MVKCLDNDIKYQKDLSLFFHSPDFILFFAHLLQSHFCVKLINFDIEILYTFKNKKKLIQVS